MALSASQYRTLKTTLRSSLSGYRDSVYALTIAIAGFTALDVAQNSWWRDTQRWTLTNPGANQYVVHDQMAYLELELAAGCSYVDVQAVSTTAAGGTTGNTIDCEFDGVAQNQSKTLQFTTPGIKQTLRLTVPGTGMRVVRLYEQECYITGLTPQTTALVRLQSAHASSCVYVGASGSQGYFALDPSADIVPGVYVFLLSWVGRMKTLRRFDASYLYAFSGNGLIDFVAAPSPATCTSWVASVIVPRCTGVNEQTVVYELGAGDYLHGVWSAAQVTNFYGYLADATHALLPNARIIFKTLLIMTTPAEGTVSASGVTQQQVRDAITAVASGRPWLIITKGYNGGAPDAETTAGSDIQDGKHATPIAERDKIFPYMRSVL